MKNKYDTEAIMKEVKKKQSDLTNEIEEGLVITYEFINPTIFIPRNPITRVIKKIILLVMRVYTKAQIVFNSNVFHTLNRLYIQNLKLSERIDELEELTKSLKKKNRAVKK